MITLITGAPGSGKTLLGVSEILREEADKGRLLIVDGVPDLVIEHQPAHPLAEWTKVVVDPSSQDGKKLLFTFPEGALVFIDEAQRVYRPRAAGSRVPPEVAAFETHRHQGLDFVIVTQHPNLIDANVRKLVGRHLHVRDLGIFGRKVYEWPECGNVEQFRNAPVQRAHSFDKKAFALYKSSSLHIKPKRGLPKGVLALAVSIPLLLAGVGAVWFSVSKKLNPQPKNEVVAVSTQGATSVTATEGHTSKTATDYLAESIPVYPGRPETAPMYAALLEVRNVPRVVGCIDTGKRCKCVTQQGTEAGLDNMQCRSWLASPPFDPYTEQSQPIVADSSVKPSAEGPKGQGVSASTEAVISERNDPKDKPA